jgi:hypothetical protein
MCLFKTPQVSVAPTVPMAQPAPPPPTPRQPDAPKPLEPAKPLTIDEAESKPNVQFGRKKSEDIAARSSGANALRIPLNTGGTTGGSGGLNV